MVARHTRPLRALGRVLVAPGFVLALWLAQQLFAKLLADPAARAARVSARGHAFFADGHQLRALVELLVDAPGLIGVITASLLSSAVLAALFSIVASPAILVRLDGQRSLRWMFGAVGRDLPAMLVMTGYGLVFRAVCTGLGVALLSKLEGPALPVALLLMSFPILALDRARATVVLDDDRPFHPKTFLRAIVHVAKRPLWWLSGTLIELAKLGVAILGLAFVLRAGPGESAIWVARAAGLVTVVLGLWRVSLAVEDRRHT
jgi:hypothetical protein